MSDEAKACLQLRSVIQLMFYPKWLKLNKQGATTGCFLLKDTGNQMTSLTRGIQFSSDLDELNILKILPLYFSVQTVPFGYFLVGYVKDLKLSKL